MRALILAAGRGSRLGQKGFGRPKCLLQMGSQRLIEHQLELLAEAGIAPVALVVGYCADDIREIVGIRAEYIENVRWESTNSLYSFSLARKWVGGELLVFNSDILLDPEIVERLLRTRGDAFAYDSGSGNAREHMKVKLENGKLADMSKELPIEESMGENVGALKFTAEGAQELFDLADARLADGGEKEWLGSAVRVLAGTREIQAVDIAGLPWAEIDSSFDLDRARKRTLVAIERRRVRKKPQWRLLRWGMIVVALTLLVVVATSAWMPETPVTWESVDIEGTQSVKLRADDRSSKWWLLPTGTAVTAEVAGPAQLRIDSRVVFPDGVVEPVPHVIEAKLDGQRLDWFAHNEPPSQSWMYEGKTLGRRARARLEIPAGVHDLELRLVASDSGTCLVRVRQTVED